MMMRTDCWETPEGGNARNVELHNLKLQLYTHMVPSIATEPLLQNNDGILNAHCARIPVTSTILMYMYSTAKYTFVSTGAQICGSY
jgi:hypothetical protein